MIDSDSDDAPISIPGVQIVNGALDLLHEIAEVTDYWGSEELSSAVMKASDILVDERVIVYST